jgi:hypothetical protein
VWQWAHDDRGQVFPIGAERRMHPFEVMANHGLPDSIRNDDIFGGCPCCNICMIVVCVPLDAPEKAEIFTLKF